MTRTLVSTLALSMFLALGCATTVTTPETSPCRDRRTWGSYLKPDRDAAISQVVGAVDRVGVPLTDEHRTALTRELKPIIQWRLIRFLLLDGENHNYGAITLSGVHTAAGSPLIVHRTGLTPRPQSAGSCFHHLLEEGGTRHVVNLYAGDIPTEDLESAERQAAEGSGATYYAARDHGEGAVGWRHALREHPGDPAVRRQAMESVAAIINGEILRPGGEAPQGNVHVHCGGGMHRTGMVVGILDRCLNGAPRDRIEAAFRHHTDWQSDSDVGGFEPENVDFVMSFDCSLLTTAPPD